MQEPADKMLYLTQSKKAKEFVFFFLFSITGNTYLALNTEVCDL